MAVQREPNTQLRALIAEAHWSGQALAHAVNQVGAETGEVLSYKRGSVAHWLTGVKPPAPVPQLVAEALSRKLGRPITVAATGLSTQPLRDKKTGTSNPDQPTLNTWQPTDTPAALADLCSTDADPARRETLRRLTYHLEIPPTTSEVRSRTMTAGVRAGPAQVEAAVSMARFFADVDTTFGGGHARAALAAYLACDIAPVLRAQTTPQIQRQLWSVAADLTYLCGFMCFDDAMHGAAQRYYLTALQLAAEADDDTTRAVVLRAMSVQAHYLGHRKQALDLAEAAYRDAAPTTPPLQAFLLGQLAVAHADTGDRHAALTHLRAAERRLDQTTETGRPIGAYHDASLAHQRAEVLIALRDRPGAITALVASLRLRPPSERRSRTITRARLADLQLDHGHLEEACTTWHHFLDDYPTIRSGRADTALKTLRARIRPYLTNPTARTLHQRASQIP